MDDAVGYVAPRTCTVVDEREPPRDGGKQAPLTDFADTAAYVLIAEPGAGKTTAFETEAAKQGAVCVTVRNFLRFDKPEWRDATLFLDGLDESRAGPGDRRTPLDGIVKKLARLGRTLVHLVNLMQDLSARGVGLRVLTGHGAQIDDTSAR